MDAAREVKEFGRPNDLVDRIAGDEAFGLTKEEISQILNPDHLCGIAPSQVEDFIREKVKPVLERYKDIYQNINIEINV